jgi:hypothetical protein
MPFYEAVGTDPHTRASRTLQLSARDERQALFAASSHGIEEVKLRPYAERELLMMDLKCFLNAEPAPRIATGTADERVRYRTSLLQDHPLLTITTAVFMALTLDRLISLLIAAL